MTQGVAERCYEVERTHWWYRGRRRILLRLLDRFLGAGDHRILDVGAGTGYLHTFLKRFGSVRGVESDPEFVRQARARNLDLDVLDFPRERPAGTYDAVMLFDVLEHLEDDLHALGVIRSLLREKGLFFITVPALSWLYSVYDQASGHYRRYDAATLKARLRRAGFEILHLTYFNSLLMPLAVAARILHLRPGNRPPPATTVERCGGLHERDLRVPSPALNWLLERILSAETSWASSRGFGTGVSLAAVARRI